MKKSDTFVIIQCYSNFEQKFRKDIRVNRGKKNNDTHNTLYFMVNEKKAGVEKFKNSTQQQKDFFC